MTSSTIPRELLEPMVAYFRPQRVILFGSRTRGDAGPDSDMDLVVVLDDDIAPDKLTVKAVAEARAGYHAPVDIILCRASKLQSRARAIGSFAHQALRAGVSVYERR